MHAYMLNKQFDEDEYTSMHKNWDETCLTRKRNVTNIGICKGSLRNIANKFRNIVSANELLQLCHNTAVFHACKYCNIHKKK